MTPFYERDGITIWCGETIETMAQLTDLFHAIIADLPYGTTACSWDTIIPFEPLWEQYKRLTRGAVVLFGSQPFTSALVMSCPEWFRYCWVWYQSHATNFLQSKKMPLKKHQDICTFYESLPTYNPQMKQGKIHKSRSGKSLRKRKDRNGTQVRGALDILDNIETNLYYPTTILEFGNGRRADSVHPTQKPVALLAYLVRTYTNPGEIILDNTMGSGTTLVAAQRERRRAVGIEISEDYCKIAVERLRQPTFWSLPSETVREPQTEQATLL